MAKAISPAPNVTSQTIKQTTNDCKILCGSPVAVLNHSRVSRKLIELFLGLRIVARVVLSEEDGYLQFFASQHLVCLGSTKQASTVFQLTRPKRTWSTLET